MWPALSFIQSLILSFSRQLRDIRQKLYLTELSSSDVQGVQEQLHHAKCIYNALSDIKPEVENVIKMGRKIVESEAVDNPQELTQKIDSLKADFNEVGAQVRRSCGAVKMAKLAHKRNLHIIKK